MSEGHALLAPSSAPIWGKCNGFLLAPPKDDNSIEARRGTAGHWVFADAVPNELDAVDYLGAKDPDGTPIDDEIAEGAQFMIDHCRQLMRDECFEPHIESRVHMPQIHKDNWGTVDLWGASGHTIWVSDYKQGHRQVEPDSLQLVDYSLGVFNELGVNVFDSAMAGCKVVLTVVQPFCYTAGGAVRSKTFTVADLLPLWQELYNQANSDPHMTTGKHCRDCPLCPYECDAARNAGYNMIDYVKAPFSTSAMSGRAIRSEYQLLKDAATVLKSRLEELDTELKERIKAGETGIGLKLSGSPGRLNWTEDDKTVLDTLRAVNFDALNRKPKTPTQAKNLAKNDPTALAVIESLSKRDDVIQLMPIEDTPSGRAFYNRG